MSVSVSGRSSFPFLSFLRVGLLSCVLIPAPFRLLVAFCLGLGSEVLGLGSEVFGRGSNVCERAPRFWG